MATETQIFHDAAVDRSFRAKWYASRVLIYGVLILWAVICLFPIYWTITTSFKMAPDVMKGNMIPWYDFRPAWLGWKSLGLSPDTIGAESTVRLEFFKRFTNSVISATVSSTLAVILGSLAAYGLSRFSYKFGYMRNPDISFFFLSQLILPPVVLALPFLVLYREVDLLDTRIGLILVYTLSVLPIVIWIMKDQFESIPTELEEAAMVDGLGVWGAFFTIILPIALPGGGVHPVAGADLERVFLCSAPHLHPCSDPAGDGGEPDRVARDLMVVDGGAELRRDPAFGDRRDIPRTVHHQGNGGRGGEVGAERDRPAAVGRDCACADADGAWR
jgi:multiple sugar transport system permease protein